MLFRSDIEKAVPVAAMAVFANSGQICIAGSRLFVAREIHDEFTRRVADYAANLRIGHGIQEGTDIGPIISARQAERIEGYLSVGPNEGAEILTGGNRVAGDDFAGGRCVRQPGELDGEFRGLGNSSTAGRAGNRRGCGGYAEHASGLHGHIPVVDWF